MSYFPIFLQMTGRRCLVIGGGAVAERKIAGLLEAGATVSVISPDITGSVARWSKQNSINFLARRYRPGDLAGYELVFVATDDAEVNAARSRVATAAWVNAPTIPLTVISYCLPSCPGISPWRCRARQQSALARTIREDWIQFSPANTNC